MINSILFPSIMTIELSTPEKIKEAARKLFSEKGYGRTTTRDIANEASVNLALVNYHFRSKEDLFKSIMLEVVSGFAGQMEVLLNDDHTFEEKVELLVANYINLITQQPDLPLFMLSELRNHPQQLAKHLDIGRIFREASFFKELRERIPESIHPVHYFMNILSMTVFPFVAKPLLSVVAGLNNDQYIDLMQERKKLIPQWIMATLKSNTK